MDRKDIIDLLINNYLTGLILLDLGILKLNNTLKKTKRNINSSLQPYTNGIAASVGLIIVGTIIIVHKMVNDW